jgi:hypothetical protein
MTFEIGESLQILDVDRHGAVSPQVTGQVHDAEVRIAKVVVIFAWGGSANRTLMGIPPARRRL